MYLILIACYLLTLEKVRLILYKLLGAPYEKKRVKNMAM